ncbi:9086_t:CDS:2, partial [Funneliformis caledonium]
METYETYEKQIIYNDDNSVNLPFGHAAKWYLVNIPLLQNYRLKNQSRQTITTRTKKSTNRIDDILVLTTKGEDLVLQINLGIEKDQQCWYWVMYCSGDGDICQHLCGGIEKYLETCDYYLLHNNLKNANDMHLCSVKVISKCRLSWLNSETPLCITIQETHHPSQHMFNNIIPKISRINLTYFVRDSIVLNRRADHRTAKEIKAKLLTPFNGASEEPIESSDRYYQLTFSDEFWLKNERDYGNICIGIDGKYDLNADRAPVLSIVLENGAGHGLPLAFALSNKENNQTIKLAIIAVKRNIPCNEILYQHRWYYENLISGNGFQRVCKCQNNNWKPYTIINKHRPSKLAIQNILCRPILCWFHIMKTYEKNLNNWHIPVQFR